MRELEASSDKILQIGYEGEDNVTTIKFLYDEEWLSHGNGEFKVRVLRNGDTEAYNATQIVDDRENMILTMTVTDIELSKKGRGELQLVYICSGAIKKSQIYKYNVSRAIDSEVVDPPQGSIVNELLYDVGDLTELTTTDKSSLVGAINEVYERSSGQSIVVDSELSTESENPVQNKAVMGAFNEAAQRLFRDELAISDNSDSISNLWEQKASTDTATQSTNGLMSSADKTKLDAVGSVVIVLGTTPTITALSGVRYVCGEVATLDITPCVSGICDIVFTSGSTATVLTLPSTVKFPDGAFTPEANTTYEINILDGVYGAVMAWT